MLDRLVENSSGIAPLLLYDSMRLGQRGGPRVSDLRSNAPYLRMNTRQMQCNYASTRTKSNAISRPSRIRWRILPKSPDMARACGRLCEAGKYRDPSPRRTDIPEKSKDFLNTRDKALPETMDECTHEHAGKTFVKASD